MSSTLFWIDSLLKTLLQVSAYLAVSQQLEAESSQWFQTFLTLHQQAQNNIASHAIMLNGITDEAPMPIPAGNPNDPHYSAHLAHLTAVGSLRNKQNALHVQERKRIQALIDYENADSVETYNMLTAIAARMQNPPPLPAKPAKAGWTLQRASIAASSLHKLCCRCRTWMFCGHTDIMPNTLVKNPDNAIPLRVQKHCQRVVAQHRTAAQHLNEFFSAAKGAAITAALVKNKNEGLVAESPNCKWKLHPITCL